MFSKGEGESQDRNCRPNPRKRNAFPSSLRIQKREEYRLIYSKGKKISSDSFSLFMLGNGFGKGRLGITVTKRVGKANKRNKVKRIFREIFRKNKDRMSKDFDMIIHAKPVVLNKNYRELEKEILELMDGLSKKDEK